ncbi:UNVERIFIED_CONTAM: hypothetical protein FKN15_011206 [Acipenser sinensis]
MNCKPGLLLVLTVSLVSSRPAPDKPGALEELQDVAEELLKAYNASNFKNVSSLLENMDLKVKCITTEESANPAQFTETACAFKDYLNKIHRHQLLLNPKDSELHRQFIYTKNQFAPFLKQFSTVCSSKECDDNPGALFKKKLLGYKVLRLFVQWLGKL